MRLRFAYRLTYGVFLNLFNNNNDNRQLSVPWQTLMLPRLPEKLEGERETAFFVPARFRASTVI